MNNLKQLGLALQNHENALGTFPPGTIGWDPSNLKNLLLHTGTFRLMPYFEQANVYGQVNLHQPYIVAPNSTVIGTSIPLFCCPSDDAYGRMIDDKIDSGIQLARGNYAMCWGSLYLYPPPPPVDPWLNTAKGLVSATVYENGGPFRYDVGRRIADFSDGLSNTIMFSEILSGAADTIVNHNGNNTADYRGIWSGGEQSNGYLHINTPNTTVADCLLIYMCGPRDLRKAPCSTFCNYQSARLAARSMHVGGVNALAGDGRVAFFTDGISTAVWSAMGTISGGEPNAYGQ